MAQVVHLQRRQCHCFNFISRRIKIYPSWRLLFEPGPNWAGPAWTVEFEWWKTDRGIRVKEYALATRVTPRLFNYMEATSPGDRRAPYASTTPGTRGQGFITITGNNKLKLTQLGRRPNGDTSIVVEYLRPVEEFPDISIPLTFPVD